MELSRQTPAPARRPRLSDGRRLSGRQNRCNPIPERQIDRSGCGICSEETTLRGQLIHSTPARKSALFDPSLR